MKMRLLVGIALLASDPAVAHDFWMQPLRFNVAAKASVGVSFQVGHGDARTRWQNSDRIVFLLDVFRGQRRDQKPGLRSDGDAELVTSFAEPGLHVLAMQTNYALSELPAIRFNDYVAAEGLAPAIAAARRDPNAPGREQYSRRAKALVQVGPATAANQETALRPVGLKLEIVPDNSPYRLGPTRALSFHVLYRGRRLPNATVMLTSLEFDAKPIATIVTDRNGSGRVRVPPIGSWLLNVLWSEPLRGNPRADFDTTFSSLTFGYDHGR